MDISPETPILILFNSIIFTKPCQQNFPALPEYFWSRATAFYPVRANDFFPKTGIAGASPQLRFRTDASPVLPQQTRNHPSPPQRKWVGNPYNSEGYYEYVVFRCETDNCTLVDKKVDDGWHVSREYRWRLGDLWEKTVEEKQDPEVQAIMTLVFRDDYQK